MNRGRPRRRAEAVAFWWSSVWGRAIDRMVSSMGRKSGIGTFHRRLLEKLSGCCENWRSLSLRRRSHDRDATGDSDPNRDADKCYAPPSRESPRGRCPRPDSTAANSVHTRHIPFEPDRRCCRSERIQRHGRCAGRKGHTTGGSCQDDNLVGHRDLQLTMMMISQTVASTNGCSLSYSIRLALYRPYITRPQLSLRIAGEGYGTLACIKKPSSGLLRPEPMVASLDYKEIKMVGAAAQRRGCLGAVISR
jgi:hypothetical protein